jgi:Trk-type K+ transport system membrane component
LVNINNRIAITTTFILLLLGFGLFLLLEWDHTLAGKTGWAKFVTAVFGSVTPRTAGFNTVDLTSMAAPTILFYLFFMWIGASPGSTGGGIKTTTIAVGLLNVLSIAKGKNRTEIFRRKVSDDSIKRAFVAILISIMVILFATFFLSITEPGKDPTKLLFEAFSAVGTVGLSLNITPDLSAGGKFIIILCMFVGRMGMLTMITAFFRKVRSLNYSYPTENIQVS